VHNSPSRSTASANRRAIWNLVSACALRRHRDNFTRDQFVTPTFWLLHCPRNELVGCHVLGGEGGHARSCCAFAVCPPCLPHLIVVPVGAGAQGACHSLPLKHQPGADDTKNRCKKRPQHGVRDMGRQIAAEDNSRN
jgi:hypothetical protein